jgi:hypothetical protein
LAMSENLKAQIDSTPHLEILSGPWEFEFDSKGDLSSLPEMAAKLGVTETVDAAFSTQH